MCCVSSHFDTLFFFSSLLIHRQHSKTADPPLSEKPHTYSSHSLGKRKHSIPTMMPSVSSIMIFPFLLVGLSTVAAFAPMKKNHGVVPNRHHHHNLGTLFPTTRLYNTAAVGDWSTAVIPRISSEQLQELTSKGVLVIENFLSPELQQALRDDVQSLRQDFSKFNIAKIGQDSTNALNTEIRVAETCFLGREKLSDTPANPARGHLYDVLDQLRQDLPQPLDANLAELLYAYYPSGGFYRRHRDAIPGSASTLRKYSLLMYLNEDWTPNKGGQLRMYYDSGGDFLPEGEAPNYKDVAPRGGTVVIFQSDKLPHEVLDTQAERYAVVGWFNRPVTVGDIAELSGNGGGAVQLVALAVAAALVTVGLVNLLT